MKRSVERLFGFWPLVFLALVPVILFAPALFGGKMLWGIDFEALGLPFNVAAQRSLQHGELPLWMPELFGGMPGIAASNLSFFYPSELIMDLLGYPASSGYALEACLQVFLAGLGMFWFLRKLGLSQGASLLGAFFFCVSGSQVSLIYAGHTNNLKAVALLPWIFGAAYQGCTEKSWFAWACCGAALGLQILGTGIQLFAYTVPVLLPCCLWWAGRGSRQAWKQSLLGLSVALLFALLLSAPQFFLSLQYIPYSSRNSFSYADFIAGSFPPREALTWLVPGFYGWFSPNYYASQSFRYTSEYFGLLPWGLACAALSAAWGRFRSFGWLLAAIALAAFLLGLGVHFPLHHLVRLLPVYSSFRLWSRFLIFLTFAVCILAAMGWDALGLEENRTARRGVFIFFGVALLAALFAYLEVPRWIPAYTQSLAAISAIKTAGLSLVLAYLFWRFTAKDLRGLLALGLLLGIHAFDQSEVARSFVRYQDQPEILKPMQAFQSLPPNSGLEPWRLVNMQKVWDGNKGALFGYEDLIGNHGLPLSGALRLQQAMQGRQADWLNLMNVRYVLSLEAMPGLRLLSDTDAKVYANPGAFPRAWLVSAVDEVKDEDAAYARLGDPKLNLAKLAVVEQSLGLSTQLGAVPQSLKGAAVQWQQRSNNAFGLEVNCPVDALLVVSNNWYPAWRAKVDGVEEPVLKADGNLQAIVMKAGKHQVEFIYSARLLWLAFAAFLLGLGLLFALWKLEKGRYNRQNLEGL